MLKSFINLYFGKEKGFSKQLKNITGYAPREPFLYRLALRHSSLVTARKESARECNERLEFLGDSIIDAVISEHLFKLYPTQDEGFLTEMRAKIVNRQSLNEICLKLKIDQLIQFNNSRRGQVNRSMYGDALEAFVGALYIDVGFERTKKFILRNVLSEHVDLDMLEFTIYNYKSMLLEHVQKEKLETITYDLVEERGDGNNKFFKIQVKIGDKTVGTGTGKKKKVAEQNASEDALLRLKVIVKDNTGKNEVNGNPSR